MVLYDYGVDLKSSFTFKDGDLELVDGDDNISQAISNRLNTITDSLDLFYEDYGSLFLGFLGWKRNDETLRFMKIELDKALSDDPRIDSFTSELSYTDTGAVRIDISLNGFENTELNLILDGTSVSVVEEEAI